MSPVKRLTAMEVLDSRGNPTLSVTCHLEDGTRAKAGVPSGASTGKREALELRDGGERFGGRGVLKAAANVEGDISRALTGMDPSCQEAVDRRLLELDGTPGKARMGANAIVGASMAVWRAGRAAQGRPLYDGGTLLPTPMLNVINGGAHADNNLDVQEFMLLPAGFERYCDALRAGAECFQALKRLLSDAGKSTSVGDEGGFAPDLASNEEALDFLVRAIEAAGYRPGEQVSIALDTAASGLWEGGKYRFEGEKLSPDELASVYEGWAGSYPLLSLEDGLGEDDLDGWKRLVARLGKRIQIVGDDTYVTDPKAVRRGVEEKTANAVLVKLNQIGTVTETLETISVAKKAGWGVVISHRSGETVDSFIADFAVATEAGQLKSGSVCRSERTAKYNRLLEVERELGKKARFCGKAPYGG